MRNKSQNLTTINVSKLLAPIISSRDVASVLEDKIKKTDTESVLLDFTNIKFISRSATHSLLLLKEKFESKTSNRKEVSFINANNDIAEMFRVIAANRALPKKEKPEFNPEKIDISSLLKEAV
jgi:anti-anti-sigma regulatory factor